MTGSTPHDVGSSTPRVTAVARIMVNTSDLGRFRAFYEGLLRLPHVITLRMQEPPQLSFGVFAVGDTALQAIEVPGFDPAATASTGSGERIAHFALLVPDEASLLDVGERLVAAGASDGAITSMGPYLSVSFRDPDGLRGEITCPNPAFDPARTDEEVLECSIGPEWTNDLLAGSRSAEHLDA